MSEGEKSSAHYQIYYGGSDEPRYDPDRDPFLKRWHPTPPSMPAPMAVKPAPEPPQPMLKVDQCTEWLTGLLIEKGLIGSNELLGLAKAQGFSQMTLERARKAIGARALRSKGKWFVSR